MAEISLQEYCGQIEDMVAQGRYTEAVAHGKHILEQYPKYVGAYRLLGKAMLEARQGPYAADMFRRVLSADPEDMLAWVALSELYDQEEDLGATLWCLERAFELAIDNVVVEEELRKLYGRRDGVEPERVQLTRGALARLYLKGDLLARAIGELRALLAEQPERVDLAVALAEALWRNEQRLEAAEICQSLLDRLSYCLKANLILGEIWVTSGRGEGELYLRRAEALDPENVMAQMVFGDASPLPAREVQIVPLEYRPTAGEERPEWTVGVEAASTGLPLSEREATLVDIAAGLEAQIEIPAWLEEIDVGESAPTGPAGFWEEPAPALAEVPDWLQEVAPEEEAAPGPAVAEIPDWLQEVAPEEEAAPEPAVAEVPDWMQEIAQVEEAAPGPVTAEIPDWLQEMAPKEEAAPRPAPTDIPGWIQGVAPMEGAAEEEVVGGETLEEMTGAGPEPIEEEVQGMGEEGEEEIPDWLSKLRVGPIGEEEPAVSGGEEVPEWLSETGAEVVAGEESAPAPSGEQPPDWLSGLRDQFAEELPAPEPIPPEEAAPAGEEEAGVPSWLEGEGMPSGDEAVAWLEQLAAGKEEELLAQIEVETEARLAEIMGRKPEEPAVEEVAPEEMAPVTPTLAVAEEPIPEEAAAAMVEPERAEIPDWLQKLAPPEVAAGVAEEAAPPEAAPKEELAPTGEEGFGWTTFEAAEAPPAAAPLAAEAAPAGGEEAGVPPWLEGEGMPSGDEALAWLEQLAAGKEEELLAQIEVETEARLAEIMGRKPEEPAVEEVAPEEAVVLPIEEVAPPVAGEAVVAPPVEEVVAPEAEGAFGWATFGEAETPPDIGAVVEKAPSAEAPPMPEAAERVREEVEAPPAVEFPAAALREEMPPPAPVPAAEEVGAPEAEAVPTPAAPQAAPPTMAPLEGPLAAVKAYVKEHPRDYEVRLKLARALWQAGEREEALEAYDRVVRAGKFLDSIIPELEEYLEQWPDVGTQRVLGDAYMKDGRLQDALDLYRLALENL